MICDGRDADDRERKGFTDGRAYVHCVGRGDSDRSRTRFEQQNDNDDNDNCYDTDTTLKSFLQQSTDDGGKSVTFCFIHTRDRRPT